MFYAYSSTCNIIPIVIITAYIITLKKGYSYLICSCADCNVYIIFHVYNNNNLSFYMPVWYLYIYTCVVPIYIYLCGTYIYLPGVVSIYTYLYGSYISLLV